MHHQLYAPTTLSTKGLLEESDSVWPVKSELGIKSNTEEKDAKAEVIA